MARLYGSPQMTLPIDPSSPLLLPSLLSPMATPSNANQMTLPIDPSSPPPVTSQPAISYGSLKTPSNDKFAIFSLHD